MTPRLRRALVLSVATATALPALAFSATSPAAAEATAISGVSGTAVNLGIPAAWPLGSSNVYSLESGPKGCILDEDLDVNTGTFFETVTCPAGSTGGTLVIAERPPLPEGSIVTASNPRTFTLAFPKGSDTNMMAPSIEVMAPSSFCAGEVTFGVTAYGSSSGISSLPVKLSSSVTTPGAAKPTVASASVKTDARGRAMATLKVPAGATLSYATTAAGQFSAVTGSIAGTAVDCTGAALSATGSNWPSYANVGQYVMASLDVHASTSGNPVASATATVNMVYTDVKNATKTVKLGTGKVGPMADDMGLSSMRMDKYMDLPGFAPDKPGILVKMPTALPTDIKPGTTATVQAVLTKDSTGSATATTVTLGNLPTLAATTMPSIFGQILPPSPEYPAAGVRANLNIEAGPGACIPGVSFTVVVKDATGTEAKVGSGKTDGLCSTLPVKLTPKVSGDVIVRVKESTSFPAYERNLGHVDVPAALTVAATASGASQTLTAKLNPANAGVLVTFSGTLNGTTTVLGTALTNDGGVATLNWAPSATGTYEVSASAAATTKNGLSLSAEKLVKVTTVA